MNDFQLMKNLPVKFTATGSDVSIEVRGPYRMSCAQIALVTRETQYDRETKTLVEVSPSDNVPMAIAVLGTGRMTEDMEKQAEEIVAGLGTTTFEEDLVDRALVSLRAVMLLRDKQEAERVAQAAEKKAESDKMLLDAYTLYLLSMPEGGEVLESVEAFRGTQESREWGNRLMQLRQGLKMGGF